MCSSSWDNHADMTTATAQRSKFVFRCIRSIIHLFIKLASLEVEEKIICCSFRCQQRKKKSQMDKKFVCNRNRRLTVQPSICFLGHFFPFYSDLIKRLLWLPGKKRSRHRELNYNYARFWSSCPASFWTDDGSWLQQIHVICRKIGIYQSNFFLIRITFRQRLFGSNFHLQ